MRQFLKIKNLLDNKIMVLEKIKQKKSSDLLTQLLNKLDYNLAYFFMLKKGGGKMPRRKENPRIETFNKLIKAGKSNEKDILNLKIEDLKDITKDKDVQNIIILREYIKNHNTIEYFNYIQTNERKEEN